MKSRALVATLLVLLVVLGTALRIQGALGASGFDAGDASGMFVTDPGVLAYLHDGVEDLRADPLLRHPEEVDVLAEYTYGQELLLPLARALVGDERPPHMVTLWLAAFLGASVVVPLFLLARALTGSAGWALGGVLWYALLPASHRTMGFVFMREDLSLVFLAWHLALLTIASRKPRTSWALAAGISLGLALATWHAIASVLLLEALVLAVLQFTRRAPVLVGRPALVGLLAVTAFTLLIPVLRASATWLAPGLLLAWGLWIAGGLATFAARPRLLTIGAGLGLAVVAVLLGSALGLSGEQRHVAEVLFAKLTHLGQLPVDPTLLSFEARMLWQGPFRTLSQSAAWDAFKLGLLVLVVLLGAGALTFRRGDPVEAGLSLGLWASTLAALMVERLVVLPALLLPVLLARAAQRTGGKELNLLAVLGFAGFTFLQAVAFGSWVSQNPTWYEQVRPAEVAAAVRAVEEHVPAGAAVAADFMLSGALLRESRRPIVLNPKWETAVSRDRVRRFWHALYHQDPRALRHLLQDEWKTDWLLIDRRTLWLNLDSRYLAAYRRDEPPRPGTAAALLLAPEPGEGEGYRLVWSGPDPARPRFRLYALAPAD